MTWSYGAEGEALPVRPGDTWAVGDHLFLCSDLMAISHFDVLVARYKPTLLYCDPPWGQALVNGFRTKAGLGKATYRWEQLYHRVASMGHQAEVPVWMEGSKVESRDGRKIGDIIRPETEGRVYDAYFPMTYYRKNPAGLYYAGTVPPPDELVRELPGMDDEDTPRAVMEAYPIGVVVDPLAGRGGTALAAHAVGWSSINNELNPHRVSAALVRLADAIGMEPQLR